MSDPTALVVDAAWRDRARQDVCERELLQALALARRNLVAGWLVRTYGDRVPALSRAGAHERVTGWRTTVDELGRLLGEAGVAAVLIKSGLEGRDPFDDRPLAAVEYGDIDLVAGAEAWDAALSALRRWGRAEGPARFEPHKAIVRPAVGPAAHLHREAEWFGVPVITIEALRARASPMPNGLLLPSPRDAIVLLVAHAVFQTLELTLADLLEMRRLASVGAIDDARIVARAGGWEDAFGHAVRRASATIAALDRGALPAVPVSIAGVPALLDGWRHAANLARRRKPMLALRELALRPCLVAAKVRRAAA